MIAMPLPTGMVWNQSPLRTFLTADTADNRFVPHHLSRRPGRCRVVRFEGRRKSLNRAGMEDTFMFRDVILWIAGVPIVVIVLLHLTGFIHF